MNDTLPLGALGIMMVRPGFLILGAPIFGGQFVPAQIRLALTVLFGVLMMPLAKVSTDGPPLAIAMTVAGEAVVGIALSLAIRALVAGAELAGHVAGFQIGFSYASLVDPQSGARNNVVAMLYGSLATLTFFGINGHHQLLRALARSYEWLPPGQWHLASSLSGAIPRILGIVFVLGVQLAMPIMVVLLLVELLLGVVSRAAPALNLLALGFSIRVAVGLLVLGVGMTIVPDAIARFAPAAMEAAARLITSAPR